MKKGLILTGSILLVIGLFQAGQFILLHQSLDKYGQGFLAGSIFLIIIGLALIIIGRKWNGRKHQSF